MSHINLSSHAKRDLTARATTIAGRTYLSKGPSTYELGDIELAIWSRLDGRTSLEVIAGGIAQDFDAPETVIQTDLVEFVGDLEAQGLIRLVGAK